MVRVKSVKLLGYSNTTTQYIAIHKCEVKK